jgi:hypothetical protein
LLLFRGLGRPSPAGAGGAEISRRELTGVSADGNRKETSENLNHSSLRGVEPYESSDAGDNHGSQSPFHRFDRSKHAFADRDRCAHPPGLDAFRCLAGDSARHGRRRAPDHLISSDGDIAMKRIVLVVLALAIAALVLAISSAEAAMVRRVPDLTAIAPAPVVAVATEQAVKRHVANNEDTDTAD